jgi:phospholipid/cholesterol/gamma-HCH transport system permease protein
MSSAGVADWRIERRGDTALLTLSGDWLFEGSGSRTVADLRQLREQVGDCTRLGFECRAVARWDSALVAFVRALQAGGGPGLTLDLSGLPVPAQRLLSLAAADHGLGDPDDPPAHHSLAWRVGAMVLRAWGEVVAGTELLGLTVLSIGPALSGRLRARAADVVALMRESGSGAVGIIAIVNGLVGAILAFVGAVQLQRFGASIYVANLVGITVIREMAPIMTAIVMAGRTGGAYAAQIATMEGNEEIDALRALGISPYDYLVVPRVVALVAMMPVMYFYACLVGLAGGLLVSSIMLDMAPRVFLGQLRGGIGPAEFYIGVTKSVVFGAYIALAGCRLGLSAGRSAADVGRAATSAVVACIIGIIALDAVFAACTNVLGI